MRLLLLTLVACGSSTTPTTTPSPKPDPIRQVEVSLLPVVVVRGETVAKTLAERMREYKINALSIAVFDDYKIVWSKAYGMADVEGQVPADPDTTFLAGSISKSVNALGQLKAVEAGKLVLDGPINNSLKSWKLEDNELTKAKPVTLRMLLSHTGGLTVHGFRGYAPSEPKPTILETLDGKPPANNAPIRVDLAPGTKFRYAGGGTTISQLAITEQYGQPYPELMQALVLGPLGMTQSSYDQVLTPERLAHAAVGYDGNGKPSDGKRFVYPEMAAAGLWTRPIDLAKFFIEIAKARAGKSTLVSKQIGDWMTTKVAPLDDGRDAIGIGVFLTDRNGTAWFGHGGADIGFQANTSVSLDGGRGIIIMTNSENGFRLFAELERTIVSAMGWPGADQPITRVAMEPAQRAKLVGRYRFPDGPYEIVDRGGKLVGRRPFGDGDELVPTGPDVVVDTSDARKLQITATGLHATSPRASVDVARADHPLFLLEADRFDEAVAALKGMKDLKEEEQRVNFLGYRTMEKDPAKAAIILRLNAVAFPDSSNAHDSYAEALAKSGKVAEAIAEYEQELATLEADARLPAAEKPTFKKHAEDEIAKLRR